MQVNGYLENLGTERLCDLKVAVTANSKLGFEAVWPKWALQVRSVLSTHTYAQHWTTKEEP